MKIDLKELEALARAATPGPWHAQDQHADNGEFSHVGVETDDGMEIIGEELGPGDADTRFIAAANPAAVLELIALARQADTIHIPLLTDAELIERFPLPGAPVQRINLSHGAYVERETKTTGEPGWLLCAPDGTAVRGLNEYEAEFIDSALRAASEPAQPVQPVQQPAPVAKAATPTQTGMQSLEWDAVNSAANTANNNFGQWMRERWLQEFVKAYNASIPAHPVQPDADLAKRLTHERDALGQAIADAALKAGMYSGEVPLTGPHLIMFAQHLGEAATVQPDRGLHAALLEQAAQACDQQADGTNGPYRSACLQCANAVRALRDDAVNAEVATPTSQETPS